MMRYSCLALVLLCSSGAVAHDETTTPPAALYAASVFIEDASGVGCIDTAGSRFFGTLNYAGFNGTRAGLRIPATDFGMAGMSTLALTVTSGVGTTHQQGTFSWTGIGVGLSWSTKGNFSATIIPIDHVSFAVQLKQTYSQCTESINVGLTKIGARLT